MNLGKWKCIVRPYYHPVRNVIRRSWISAKASVARVLLHDAYRHEFSFFENIRATTYTDQEYKAKRIRMFTHWVDKSLTMTERVDKTVMAKQVRSLVEELDRNVESNISTVKWVKDVLGLYDAPDAPVDPKGEVPQEAACVLREIIKTRRSVRSYTRREIDDELLKDILDAGQWAPTGCNRQAIEYLIVNDPEDVLFCRKYAGEYCTFPQEAAVNIVVLADPRAYSLPRQRHMAYLEGGAAIQNILLTAHANGIGSCWMFWAKNDTEFNKRFKLAPWLLPVSMICLGYANRLPPIVPGRKRISDSIHDCRTNNDMDFQKDEPN